MCSDTSYLHIWARNHEEFVSLGRWKELEYLFSRSGKGMKGRSEGPAMCGKKKGVGHIFWSGTYIIPSHPSLTNQTEGKSHPLTQTFQQGRPPIKSLVLSAKLGKAERKKSTKWTLPIRPLTKLLPRNVVVRFHKIGSTVTYRMYLLQGKKEKKKRKKKGVSN